MSHDLFQALRALGIVPSNPFRCPSPGLRTSPHICVWVGTQLKSPGASLAANLPSGPWPPCLPWPPSSSCSSRLSTGHLTAFSFLGGQCSLVSDVQYFENHFFIYFVWNIVVSCSIVNPASIISCWSEMELKLVI